LTVAETVELALERSHPAGVLGGIIGAPWSRLVQRAVRDDAHSILERFGLGEYAHVPTDRLSTGVRHICELAALAATRPRLLVLDEPTSGIAQVETAPLTAMIRRFADEAQCAVIVVEHDLPALISLADRIYCLDRGRVIAHGEPEVVCRDPAVVAAYLGTARRYRRQRDRVGSRT
jgi:branched-chain amino acid transport system ATP-binding protein